MSEPWPADQNLVNAPSGRARTGCGRPGPADLALARSGDAEPLAAARILEHQIAELGGPPTAILCEEVDPTLLLAKETLTRFLPYPSGKGDRWIENLDAMLPT